MTLDELKRLRADLFKARLRGVREVQDQNGEKVAYSSDAEMKAALAAADRAIAEAQAGPMPSRIVFRSSKGL